MNLSNFSDFTRIVILDDQKDQGNGIKYALEKLKIPSVFFHVTSNSILPKKPYKNIRLIFLDLIFSDSGARNAAQNASNALTKLSKIVAENGFYILVIWSAHTTEEVATVFKDHLKRQTNFAQPYRLLVLQKTDYSSDGRKYNMKAILKKINEELEQIPALQVFSDWESLSTNSISDVAGKIAGQKNQVELSKTLNSLSFAYAGKGRSKVPQNSLLVLNEIFQDAVSKEITSFNFGKLYRKIDDGELDEAEKAKLNTSLMFTPDTYIGPGSIFRIKLRKATKGGFIKAIIEQDKDTIGAAYNKLIPISVEVTPLCNAAQRSGKHRYFLNGIIHPKFFINTNGKKKDIKIKNDYCFMLDKSFWDETTNEILKFSFNLKLFHSTSALPKEYISMNKKLRDNFVIEIQHVVSSYISRPGNILL